MLVRESSGEGTAKVRRREQDENESGSDATEERPQVGQQNIAETKGVIGYGQPLAANPEFRGVS